MATPDELDIVDRLVDKEAVFHAGIPMCCPYRRDDTADAVRASSPVRASDDPAFPIVRGGARDVGVVSVGPGLGSPLYVPDDAAYIVATAMRPDERGSGAGAALVEASFAWARDHGHLAASCTLLHAERDVDIVELVPASFPSWPTCADGSTSASSPAAHPCERRSPRAGPSLTPRLDWHQ